jgi:hypothetical protein
MLKQTAFPGGEQCTDGAAVAARRKTARVAMSECASPRNEQLGGVRGHTPAALDLVGVKTSSALVRRVGTHRVESPGEIDGSRPRCSQHTICSPEILAVGCRQRDPVGGCDTDRRRSAHDHRLDRICDLDCRPAFDLDLVERQAPLVEEDHCVLLEPEDSLRLEHGCA